MVHIDNTKHLKEALGPVKCDRIRYASRHKVRPRKGDIVNCYIWAMQCKRPETPGCNISNLFHGMAHTVTDDNTKPLNINRIYNIMQCMEVINTREIMAMMNVGERQAQRYFKAIKCAWPFLEKLLTKDSEMPDVEYEIGGIEELTLQ